MYPVLLRLPLPRWTAPALPLLLVLALLLTGLALIAWRKGLRDLVVLGGAGALLSAGSAIGLRGTSFQLEPIPVYTYGLLLCVSLIVGWHLTLRLADAEGLPRVQVANCYFWTALSGLVGARLLYAVTNWHQLGHPLELLDFRSGGMVAYGGFLGGLLGSLVYARRRRLDWLAWADTAAPSVAAGLALTRLGCYSFGCDFGKPLGAAAPGWLRAIGTFPHWPDTTLSHASGSPAWLSHVTNRGLPYDSPTSLPVHPTQLYESLIGAALLGLLLWVWPRRRFKGEVVLVFWFGYGVARFLLEFLRDDPERGAFGPFVPLPALVTLGLLAFGAAWGAGPARLPAHAPLRIAALAAWPAAALAGYLLLRSSAASVQLSTSQWLALLSVIAAAAAWSGVERLSAAAPADIAPSPRP